MKFEKPLLAPSERRKNCTEMLAGALLGFTALIAIGLVLSAGKFDPNDPMELLYGLTSASVGALGADYGVYGSSPNTSSDFTYVPPTVDDDLSSLTDSLIGLSRQGWGIDEAPQETEDPADYTELPSDSLPYPDSLGSSGGSIVRKTYSYNATSSCVELSGGGMLRNSTDIDTEYLLSEANKAPDIEITLDSEPQVLIIHTHTTECYEPYARDYYDEDFNSRTTDLLKSVVAVGDEIAAVLEAAGIGVIHDTEMYDYPQYTGAYDRSSIAIESILAEYPSIKIVIDVHRDAIESDGVRYAPVCEVDGETAAQVMIICGCLNVPNYRYNLRFAAALQSQMESDYEGFTRPILFAERNYNQELTHASILIEVGSNSNSLDEALYAGKLVGMSLAEVLTGLAEN